jgi:hypothetical protein
MMYTADIATLLKEVRMTPSELADEFGMPRGQLSRLIAGEEEPDRLTRWAFAGLRSTRLTNPTANPPDVATEAPRNPLAKELSDDTWTGKTARLALPILVDVAKRRDTLTYTQLHEAVAARGGKAEMGKMTKYAFPLGRIATAMMRLKLPPLTSIVVKGTTGLPSYGIDSFIADHLDLNREEREALKHDEAVRRTYVAKLWDQVYGYKNWPDVMTQLGITGDPEFDL